METSGIATQEQIDTWKLQFGRVYKLEFPARTRTIRNPKYSADVEDAKSEDEPKEPEYITETFAEAKICYLKKPDRKILKYAQGAMKKTGSELDFNETLLNNCWLGGDEAIKNEDAYIIGAGAFIGNILDIADAELEEL